MAGGEARLIGKSTTSPFGCSPRFLLPRASGGRLPPLPPPPSRLDLVLGDGIHAKFDGWPSEPLDLWAEWVAKLRPLYEPLWRELGILEGILATTYRVRRGSEAALIQLVPFWSPQTNTFVFPWGEATVTLEDVATLAGVPLAGCSARAPLWDRPDMQDLSVLAAVRGCLIQSKTAGWIEHFLRCRRHQRRPDEAPAAAAPGGGHDEEILEHGAFLSMWLSHFVLPAPPQSAFPAEGVLPIAVRLARGDIVALAPAVLASIYSDLTALNKRHLVSARRTDPPSVSAPMHILQLWVWERFPELRPAPASIAGSSSSGGGAAVVPRAARWHDVSRALEPGYVQAVFKAPGRFEWRPYGNRAPLLSSFRCLHPCELVGMEAIEQHSPHRVARQLGFDQDVPGMATRLNSHSWERAWETYDIGAGYYEFAAPSDEPGVTDEYAQWWKPYSMSCDIDAAVDDLDSVCQVLMDMLDDYEDRDGRSEEAILASQKMFCSRLEEIVEASIMGSAGNPRKPAEGKTEQGSSGEVDTNTLYYLGPLGLPKETRDKDANSTGSAQHGIFHPKREVGTMEMVQEASEMREIEKAELMKYTKLAKEIREAGEPPKK